MTVEEVLRESGFTNEQIAGMDSRAITAFTGVLSQADKERMEAKAAQDAAELAQRSNVEFYDNRIAPSLLAWEEEKQRIENEKARVIAEAAFYKAQAEAAKASGFIATDAPGFDAARFTPPNPSIPPRDVGGRYVAGAPGGTPGSPQFFDVNKVYERAGDAVGIIADIQWEHQRLYNKPLPISPTELIRQADAVKLDPKIYAARTFNFDTRREEMRREEEKARDAKLVADAVAPYELKIKEAEEHEKKAVADTDRKWAESVGSNPDLRRPQATPQMTEVARAAKNDPNLDPLNMTEHQRRAQTAKMIRSDIESQVA